VNVHFIWWGPFNEEACERIQTLSHLRLKHSFRLWCRSAEHDAFRAALPLRIAVVGVDPQLRLNGLPTEWKELTVSDITGVLQTLDGFRTFAAAKDLLSLLALYRFGGLYLDTSCRLLSGFERGWYQAPTFDDAMTGVEDSDVFRVPLLHDQAAWQHQIGVVTHNAVISGTDYFGQSPLDGPPPGAVAVPAIDVWAMFASKGEPILATIIKSYVGRAAKVGLAQDFIANGDTASVRAAFANAIATTAVDERGARARKEDRTFRNAVLGNLIVRAVYDGLALHDAVGQLSSAPAWRTVKHTTAEAEPTAKYYVLPAVSVLKTYGNSWR